MPNIQGENSLSETALKVGTSTAWINKIQSRAKICEKSGEKGRRASFTEDDIKILINVKMLRALDYDISEIASIYKEEEAMMSLYMSVFPHTGILSGNNNYILHPYTFYYPFDKDDAGNNFDEKSAKAYKESAEFIVKISNEVAKRAERLAGYLTGIKQKMEQNVNNALERM